MEVIECGNVAPWQIPAEEGWAVKGWGGSQGEPAVKVPLGHPKSHPGCGNLKFWWQLLSCWSVQDKPNLILSLRLQLWGFILG